MLPKLDQLESTVSNMRRELNLDTISNVAGIKDILNDKEPDWFLATMALGSIMAQARITGLAAMPYLWRVKSVLKNPDCRDETMLKDACEALDQLIDEATDEI